ncbi:MAG TPA: hypothetical protein VFI42_05665 [Thermomicrobiaceae bacterium]|nr:hypothetical protein [Thermomicrobiaceae bacterium]
MTITEPTRQQLHDLVDQLPDAELPAVERYLAALVALATAPIDTEPLTPEEAAILAAPPGPTIPWKQVRSEILGE